MAGVKVLNVYSDDINYASLTLTAFNPFFPS
jgi:hypothetical protein